MNENELIRLGTVGAIIVGIGVIGGSKFFREIDNGYVGVRYLVNGGIRDEALTQGARFVGIGKVIRYPIRLQAAQSKNTSVLTSGGRKITINIKYDYKVDSAKAARMYKELGNITSEDIESGWLKSKLQKVACEVCVKYSLLDILSENSSRVEAEVLTDFTRSVESKGFEVEDVTLGVPDIDKETQKSVDAITQAGQGNGEAKLDAGTTKAQTGSEAYKKTKAAGAKTESNRKVTESVINNLIRYGEAQARKKHGWVTIDEADTVVADEAGK